MKIRLKRWLYRVLWWFAHDVGIRAGSDIAYGFYRKYPRPGQIPDAELDQAIKRLHEGIQAAS